MSVIHEIAAERKRQVEVEGWTPEHDDAHRSGEMACAAACYALCAGVGSNDLIGLLGRYWPWSVEWWKPKGRRRDLIRAAALIVAEIERLDRAASPEEHCPDHIASESDPKVCGRCGVHVDSFRLDEGDTGAISS